MMNLKAGDVIKSYDFSKELHPETYMMGVVQSVEGDWIEAKVIAQLFAGDVVERPEALKNALFRTPLQGKGMFDDRDTRIELVATAEQMQEIMIGEEN